ncbi:unnamed protein product [Rhodiola kirilowii]
MVDFGGGLVIGGSGLQWLVWIQLLVMILIVVLIYCLSLYALEIDDGDVRVSSLEELAAGEGRVRLLSESAKNLNLRVEGETSFLRNSLKVGGSSSIRGEISTSGVSRRIVGSHDGTEGDGASVKDITANTNHAVTETHHHPCFIFKFAREVFLKCLGLDCMAEDSTDRKRRKTE